MKNINISEFELFLFDMDGTLVNTEPLHAKAMEMVLVKNQLATPSFEESMERFTGMTDAVVLETLYPHLAQERRDQIIRDKNSELKTVFRNLDKANLEKLMAPGILDFIHYLKSNQKNIAVVSASENEVVFETLTAFSLIDLFDFWLGRGSTHRTKPHPDPYVHAMKKAQIEKNLTLIFEDSVTGLTAAKASGAKVIEVAPFGKENYLKDFRSLFIKS